MIDTENPVYIPENANLSVYVTYNQTEARTMLTAINSQGQSESQAWNKVKIGDKWYAIDCTWDDPVASNLTEGMNEDICYLYFLITDEDMSFDHTWDNSGMPSATSTDLGIIYQTYARVEKFTSDNAAYNYICNEIEQEINKSSFDITIKVLTTDGSTLGDQVYNLLTSLNLGGSISSKSAGFYGMEFEVNAYR